MTRAVLWKEIREQGAILIALVLLGSAIIAATAAFGGTSNADEGALNLRSYSNAPRLTAMAIVLTAGVVVGGALFAGERENDTFHFLEQLPANRWRVWRAKMIAGFVLVVIVAMALLLAALLAGVFGSGRMQMMWVFWGLVLAVGAFGWGTFGSSFSHSTLAACGLGLMFATLVGMVVFPFVSVVFLSTGLARGDDQETMDLPIHASAYLLILIPAVLSYAVFTKPDRLRIAEELTPGLIVTAKKSARRVAKRRLGFGFRALAWLAFRQMRWPLIIGFILSLAVGALALHPDVPMLFIWPSATLFAGVIAAVLGWSDEQTRGSWAFWGERRIPIGRFWFAKIASGFAVALVWSFAVTVPSLVRYAFETRQEQSGGAFRTGLFASDSASQIYYLFIFILHGYAFGLVSGLLFRKTVVAVGVGTLVGGPLALLWVPSLLTGGVQYWQIFVVPLLAVLAARFLMRAWASDRLGTRKPLVALGSIGFAMIAFTTFAILHRAIEVPLLPETDDDIRFAETVPQLDSEDGGRAYRRVAALFREINHDGRSELPLFPQEIENEKNGQIAPMYIAQIGRVLKYGWPANRPDLEAWMDKQFANDWDVEAREIVKKPLGPIENPRGLIYNSQLRDMSDSPGVIFFLIARGYQKQAAGDPEAYLTYLETALAITRNARTQQPRSCHSYGIAGEETCLVSINVWLERLEGRPDLLRKLTAILDHHSATRPAESKEIFTVERMIARNTFNAPSQWLKAKQIEQLHGMKRPAEGSATDARAELEANLISFSWVVPWERERLRRIIGLGNQLYRLNQLTEYSGRTFEDQLGMYANPLRVPNSMFAITRSRLQTAKTAVCLYRAEVGSLPPTLDALVPKYLPAVPLDLYDGKPIRYRISTGETIESEYETQRDTSTQRLPGFEFVNEEEWHGHMAIGGGLLAQGRLPLVEKIPGISADGTQTVDLRAVSAAMGSVVQWPLEPLDEENGFGFGPGAQPTIGDGRGKFESNPVLPDEKRRVKQEISPGQAILWSTGPDRIDDGSIRQFAHQNTRNNPIDDSSIHQFAHQYLSNNSIGFHEDIIEVVPLTAAQRKAKK